MLSIILSCLLSLSLQLANTAAQNNDYEKSLNILSKVSITANNYNQYCYLKIVGNYGTNEIKETTKWIKNLKDSPYGQDSIPERYLSIAYHIESDIKKYGKNPLFDISKKMGDVAKRLENSKGGPVTQEKQRKIVFDLDEWIKEEEQRREEAAKIALESKEQSEKPLEDKDKPNPIEGMGKVDEKKLKEISENWAKMLPKERESAILEMSKDLPWRYRSIIEEYSRSISHGKGKKDGDK